ncbi:MAG: peptidylprolyl isomerase [Planctomycetes bacterium]|nr:peptidylprolyl isomerase [Planctomycetota bacterium]
MLRTEALGIGRLVVRLTLVAAWFVVSVGCGKSPAGADAAATGGAASTESDLPVVELRTSLGVIKLQLEQPRAPETVENFLTYVERGHYNGTIFHQVEKGYALLGGGYTSELVERPGRYPIRNEANNGLKNTRGTIAMARVPSAINSATCQFVINLGDNVELDHQGDAPEQYGYCVFGRVIEGNEILDRIAATPVEQKGEFTSLPRQAVVIESAKRLR